MDENLRTTLRKKMLDERNKLTPIQVMDLSSKIAAKLNELEPIRNADAIMVFASIKNEVNLSMFMENKKSEGKTILLPRVKDENNMEAVEFTSWEHIAEGPYGIKEPVGEAYDAGKIDVVLVPGLVFDYKGYRLGYGKGYYDRFLTQLKKGAFICGVGYEFQVVKDIMPHEADIPVHWIVTDKSELCIDWDYF